MAVLAKVAGVVVCGAVLVLAVAGTAPTQPDPWEQHRAEIVEALGSLRSHEGRHQVLRHATEMALTNRIQAYLETAGSGQSHEQAIVRMERGVANILIAYMYMQRRLDKFEEPQDGD
jgi:hypothetical protein